MIFLMPAYSEESVMSASGAVKPQNIAVGTITRLRKFEERLWIELKTGARASIKLVVPNWTRIVEEAKNVPFNDFYTRVATGDKLSVRYTTNNEWDWVSTEITVLKRKK